VVVVVPVALVSQAAEEAAAYQEAEGVGEVVAIACQVVLLEVGAQEQTAAAVVVVVVVVVVPQS